MGPETLVLENSNYSRTFTQSLSFLRSISTSEEHCDLIVWDAASRFGDVVLLEEPVLVVRSDGKGDWVHAPAPAYNFVQVLQ